MEWIVPLITLVLLEVVLGLDNVIFISIVAARLPKNQQNKARRLGLILAMFLRLALLGIISLILKLEGNLFTVFSVDISGKDLILILGGLFLIYKSASEINHKMEGEAGDTQKDLKVTSFKGVIFQILLLDLVFSIDSIITAIGMANELWIMYVAVIISVGIMFFASGPISRFVNDHPAFKMLALSFLLLIGVSLIGDGLGMHIPKGYIYFSMGFSLLVNIIQMRSTKRTALPVETKEHYLREEVRKTE
ncbi:TerC family protein [Segetibacter sp.]|jgi:predicted tellurium resistance membrane protein TerC|uniref:TerC family protein n=1 Tax=Segetibacter sp. TaxID=2231182 RepID=UPI00260A3DBA|nr:TerC family protein [Segetibacter sp.]MCW3079434.1 rane protein [Segetibacter sp.]